MWRLVPILGAVANLMPEPTRFRWQENSIWGPLFACLTATLRARGPEWRHQNGASDVDRDCSHQPQHLRRLLAVSPGTASDVLQWAEQWIPSDVWIRIGAMLQSFPGITPEHRTKAVHTLATLTNGSPDSPAPIPSQIPPEPHPPDQQRMAHTVHHRHGTPAGYKGRPLVWRTKMAELRLLQLEEILLRPFRPIRHIPHSGYSARGLLYDHRGRSIPT